MKRRILAIDPSSRTGWGFFETDESGELHLIEHGVLDFKKDTPLCLKYDHNKTDHPYDFIRFAKVVAESIRDLAENFSATEVVLEQTNKGRDRFRQKLLEFLHFAVGEALKDYKMVYMDTRQWRNAVSIKLTAGDRKVNKELKELFDKGLITAKRGKVTPKKLAINFVKNLYGIDFKVKENDIAEAICIGVAYYLEYIKEN